MDFVGWVPIRRGVLEHLVTGRLSTSEFAALMVLSLRADKSSGRGLINAPLLNSYLPDLSNDSAKRILLSLETKRYIWRQITPFSKAAYPYWINKYEITDGPNKPLQTDLSEVFETKDPTRVRYVKPAPQMPLEMPPQLPPQLPSQVPLEMPHNNNNDQDIDKAQRKRQYLKVSGECAVTSASASLSVSTERASEAEHSSPSGAPEVRHGSASVPLRVLRGSVEVPPGLPTKPRARKPMRWSPYDGAYKDSETGQELTQEAARKRFAAYGLEQRSGDFYDSASGALVAWEKAQEIFQGKAEGVKAA